VAEPLRFGKSPDEEIEPVTFEVADQTFVCIKSRTVPANAMRVVSPADDLLTVPMMFEFIESVLEDKDDPKDSEPTQVERFRRTLARKDVIVDTAELREMVISLIGAISQRPTKSPSGSTGGRRRTKPGFEGKRSGAALTSTG
jgi:hypothetical protein